MTLTRLSRSTEFGRELGAESIKPMTVGHGTSRGRSDPTDQYIERTPKAHLAGVVRVIWVQRTGSRPYLQRNLPTGGAELQCMLDGSARLIGPLTVATVQLIPPHTTVVGVRFWPGAAAALLGVAAVDLVDSTVPLNEVWGGSAERLSELLAGAPGANAAVDRMQRYLSSPPARADVADPLVTEAVRRLMPWQPVEVGELSRQLAISPSQLRRRFMVSVGVGPKTLQRTLRFQGFLALAQAAATSPWRSVGLADLAAETGYSDHAHLSRECLRLTGLRPGELLGSSGSGQCGCGHDHVASFARFLAGRRTQIEDARSVQAQDPDQAPGWRS